MTYSKIISTCTVPAQSVKPWEDRLKESGKQAERPGETYHKAWERKYPLKERRGFPLLKIVNHSICLRFLNYHI